MKRIFEKVAIEYDVSTDEVEREIAKALDIGRADNSEEARKFWDSVSNKNESISLEKVFAAIITEVHEQL